MPTKKTEPSIYQIRIGSNFNRYFSKQVVNDIRNCKCDFNLILPDFILKYKKKPIGKLDKKTLERIESNDGEFRSDHIVKNRKSLNFANFWYEIEIGHCPFDLFKGRMLAFTTLKPKEFKTLFEKQCQIYLNEFWKSRYRDCIIGDFDSVFSRLNLKTGKEVRKKNPPLDLSKRSTWEANTEARKAYVQGDKDFFAPKIQLKVV